MISTEDFYIDVYNQTMDTCKIKHRLNSQIISLCGYAKLIIQISWFRVCIKHFISKKKKEFGVSHDALNSGYVIETLGTNHN